jgi:hypothetical protein
VKEIPTYNVLDESYSDRPVEKLLSEAIPSPYPSSAERRSDLLGFRPARPTLALDSMDEATVVLLKTWYARRKVAE